MVTQTPTPRTTERLIERMISAAIEAANPYRLVHDYLSKHQSSQTRLFIVSVGKAAIPMAQAAADVLGHRVQSGIVVTKSLPDDVVLPDTFQVWQGSHPIADERSVRATDAVRHFLAQTKASDHVLCLISGGASALLTAPQIPVSTWQALNTALLHCGCSINAINTVRQHFDQVKGGGLLNWIAPASCETLILSDVIGNEIAHIGSGPTVPTQTNVEEAKQILQEYGVLERVSAETRNIITTHLNQPQPAHSNSPPVTNTIIGDVSLSAIAAASVAAKHGYIPTIVTTTLTGEAREVGARIGRKAATLPQGHCHIYGGETTVTFTTKTDGIGGRNQELALSAAIAISGQPDTWLATLATDGEDGPTDSAGAIVNTNTIIQAQQRNLNPHTHLTNHDSYTFFQQLGTGHLQIGSTGTNVNDLVIVLKSKKGSRE